MTSQDHRTPDPGAKIVFSAWLGTITIGLAIMIAIPLMGR